MSRVNPEEERGDALEETDMSALDTGSLGVLGHWSTEPPSTTGNTTHSLPAAPRPYLSELLLQTVALHVQYTAFVQVVVEEHGA